jgi:hypothetical protein
LELPSGRNKHCSIGKPKASLAYTHVALIWILALRVSGGVQLADGGIAAIEGREERTGNPWESATNVQHAPDQIESRCA